MYMNNKEANNIINKPMSVAREDFIASIVNAINSNDSLPYFIIESILKDILAEVSIMAKRQAEIERMQYEQSFNQQDSIKVVKSEIEKDE